MVKIATIASKVIELWLHVTDSDVEQLLASLTTGGLDPRLPNTEQLRENFQAVYSHLQSHSELSEQGTNLRKIFRVLTHYLVLQQPAPEENGDTPWSQLKINIYENALRIIDAYLRDIVDSASDIETTLQDCYPLLTAHPQLMLRLYTPSDTQTINQETTYLNSIIKLLPSNPQNLVKFLQFLIVKKHCMSYGDDHKEQGLYSTTDGQNHAAEIIFTMVKKEHEARETPQHHLFPQLLAALTKDFVNSFPDHHDLSKFKETTGYPTLVHACIKAQAWQAVINLLRNSDSWGYQGWNLQQCNYFTDYALHSFISHSNSFQTSAPRNYSDRGQDTFQRILELFSATSVSFCYNASLYSKPATIWIEAAQANPIPKPFVWETLITAKNSIALAVINETASVSKGEDIISNNTVAHLLAQRFITSEDNIEILNIRKIMRLLVKIPTFDLQIINSHGEQAADIAKTNRSMFYSPEWENRAPSNSRSRRRGFLGSISRGEVDTSAASRYRGSEMNRSYQSTSTTNQFDSIPTTKLNPISLPPNKPP